MPIASFLLSIYWGDHPAACAVSAPWWNAWPACFSREWRSRPSCKTPCPGQRLGTGAGARQCIAHGGRDESCAWEDWLAQTADTLAIGLPVQGWSADSRGIFSYPMLDSTLRTPGLICSSLYNGFEPGLGSLDLYQFNRVIEPGRVGVQRRTWRRLAGANRGGAYTLTIDTAWDQVVDMILQNTWTTSKGDCWLSKELAIALWDARGSPSAKVMRVAFHSIEIWCGDELVAGNVGYTVGNIYSGLSKFYLKTDDNRYSGVGMMLGSVVGAWLYRQKFKLYAMGCDRAYKRQGILAESCLLNTKRWLQEIRTARSMPNPPSLVPCEVGPINIQHLLGAPPAMK